MVLAVATVKYVRKHAARNVNAEMLAAKEIIANQTGMLFDTLNLPSPEEINHKFPIFKRISRHSRPRNKSPETPGDNNYESSRYRSSDRDRERRDERERERRH